eukprot:scaffold2512_cov120-Cylindrotheca_fusiformis.AAC.6
MDLQHRRSFEDNDDRLQHFDESLLMDRYSRGHSRAATGREHPVLKPERTLCTDSTRTRRITLPVGNHNTKMSNGEVDHRLIDKAVLCRGDRPNIRHSEFIPSLWASLDDCLSGKRVE